MADAAWLQRDGADLLLAVRVQPRASVDRIDGVRDGRLRIRITAPPADGAANEHLRRFLARIFDVAPSRVALVRGTTGRAKQLRIAGPVTLPPALAELEAS
jgi:hypothetical protein